MQHICDRCIRSFHARENLEEHYEFCIQGRAQIESLPKVKGYKSNSFDKEISPLKVVYGNKECFMKETEHCPAAIACLEKWHSEFVYTTSSMNFGVEKIVS